VRRCGRDDVIVTVLMVRHIAISAGHILRRNCLLKHVIEGKIEGRIEMTERRGRRRRQLLDDRKERRRYWKLK
jgi:hypothetical protein